MKIPKGWRKLRGTEIIRDSDKVWLGSCKWCSSGNVGRKANDSFWKLTYIRKIQRKKSK